MDRLSKSDRPHVLAAAVAQDLNDELTVILNSVSRSLDSLEPGHPAIALLVDLQSAAQRCVWRAEGLLNFSARKGYPAAPLSLDRLLKDDRLVT